ncbi:MAG TPA: aldehyde dehydrogenase family protein [Phycisphaerae bacterium]|nr:aldehyde dehydrogenase family protein [Phycisphaerae bacterium]
MRHIPILRGGEPYTSVETTTLVHHATSEIVAEVSQANSGMVRRDILHMDDRVLERFSVRELMAMSRKAADLFVHAELPLGDGVQSFDDYIAELSATTGMPVGYCRRNAEKIRKVLDEIEPIVRGLTRGFDLAILDTGYGTHAGGTLSFFREGRRFGAVLPSNSPGVHSLWIPAIVLKAPVVLKPGREEPWTPYRIIEALAAAGVPRAAFGFYPTDHAGAGELLRSIDRSMLFGGGATIEPYLADPTVEIHGPGYSKIVLGPDVADDWSAHLDVIVSSIEANGGRSCINCSAVWTPRNGEGLAEAIAGELAQRRALPTDDPAATLAAFANPAVAEQIDAAIAQGLRDGSAIDHAERLRGTPRLARIGRCAFLQPAVIWCGTREHPLANREFLFPYASVVECPVAEMPEAIGPSLIVTALTEDRGLIDALMASRNVDRLNIGPVPTWQLSWDQPHEGNLFEHLYRQRALQIQAA